MSGEPEDNSVIPSAPGKGMYGMDESVENNEKSSAEMRETDESAWESAEEDTPSLQGNEFVPTDFDIRNLGTHCVVGMVSSTF